MEGGKFKAFSRAGERFGERFSRSHKHGRGDPPHSMNRTKPLIISGRPALGIGNYLIPNPAYITLLCPDCSRLAMANLYRVLAICSV
jgi:hypothetical protein